MEHLMDSTDCLMKALGNSEVNYELKQTIIEGCAARAGTRSVDQLAQEENEALVGLLRLRAKNGEATVTSSTTAGTKLSAVSKTSRVHLTANSGIGPHLLLDVSGGRVVSVNPDGSDLESS